MVRSLVPRTDAWNFSNVARLELRDVCRRNSQVAHIERGNTGALSTGWPLPLHLP